MIMTIVGVAAAAVAVWRNVCDPSCRRGGSWCHQY